MTIADCEYYDLFKSSCKLILTDLFFECISFQPVDANIECISFLQYVNGLNEQLAEAIVAYRTENGPFFNRLQIKNVPDISPEIYRQCAPFLFINKATINQDQELIGQLYNEYDGTIIHPEMYDDADKILAQFQILKSTLGTIETQRRVREILAYHQLTSIASTLNIDPIRIRVIFQAFQHPLNFDKRLDASFISHYVRHTCLN